MRIRLVDHGHRTGVVGVCVGQDNGVESTGFFDGGEIGEDIAIAGAHANAAIDEDAFACDFYEGAGCAYFIGTA
jgi:hypothetical protein